LLPVVADCVAVVPLGAISLNVTLAPEAGKPPLVTAALIGTVVGGVKLVPEMETLIAREGAVITVVFAVPVALLVESEVVRLTGYVPGAALLGALTVRVTVPLWPGRNESKEEEKEEDHPDGRAGENVNVFGEHELESLSVRETV